MKYFDWKNIYFQFFCIWKLSWLIFFFVILKLQGSPTVWLFLDACQPNFNRNGGEGSSAFQDPVDRVLSWCAKLASCSTGGHL